jgi:hypothetical protein
VNNTTRGGGGGSDSEFNDFPNWEQCAVGVGELARGQYTLLQRVIYKYFGRRFSAEWLWYEQKSLENLDREKF